jgi:hypothetical protein
MGERDILFSTQLKKQVIQSTCEILGLGIKAFAVVQLTKPSINTSIPV